MKKVNKKSEQMLMETFNMLNTIEVKGQQNIFYLGNALNNLQLIIKQIAESEQEDENIQKEG